MFWQSIQSSANPALFEEFLKQFPSSPFADLARLKVKELKGAEVAVVVPPKASIEVDELDGAFVAIRSANIRSEPSAKSEWVGRVAADDRVNVTGKVKERDWYRVEHQGKTGFVFAPLLTALTPLSPTPGMEPLPTTARRAIFLDAASGRVLFEKAADETFEPGSIAQLMTLYLLFERLHDGKLSLEETFPVSETAWRKGGAKSGGSTMFLKPGSWVGVEDLLRGIVISSGADASIVVAETLLGSEAAFVREMENRAKSLGLSKSRFKNASGWPAPGQEMSARDAARLARRLFRDFPQYYHYFSEKAFTYNGIRQANRNPLLYKDLGADGLKTGHVASAGYGLVASVVRGGVRGILVISGLSGAKERAREAERLITLGLERLAEQASRVKELQKQKTAALVPPKAPAPGDIKIDILKFDSDGNAVMSGRAPPGAVLVVKAGDQVIGEVTADPRGEWVFIPDKPLSTAAPNIIVVPKNKGGKLAAARLPPRRPPAGRLPQGRAAARVPPPFSRARPGSPPVPVRPAIGVFPERNKPGDVFKDCADCPEMVVIPAGSFRMGDLQGGGYKAEKPVHDVRIGYAFAVGKYEVTQGEWRVMMGNDPSYFKGERNPVENVSWNDTKEYVRKLSARTGKEYRLLSEAEWEYMARAGSSTKYPWGNDISSSQARYGRQIGHGTVSVGSYAPNAFGVYDTVGNVWEWVEDCWHDSYSGAPTDGGAWMSGGECGRRVLRGGSWYYRPRYVRAALRFMIVTVSSGDSLGFRVARTLSR